MKNLRPGLIDVIAVVMVLIAILLPAEATHVEPALALQTIEGTIDLQATQAKVAELEATLVKNPADADAASSLSQTLMVLGHYDQALRVAHNAAQIESPHQWQSHLNVSSVYAERVNIQSAYDSATAALTHCKANTQTCSDIDLARLSLYMDELDGAKAAIAKGIDPREDPAAFTREVSKTHRTIHMPNLNPR